MQLTALHFYHYSEPFKSVIHTPKITLTHRDCLIIEVFNEKGKSFFGECNAFQTDWYDKETIASVQETLTQWFPTVKNQNYDTFESWQEDLRSLEATPAARATIVMALYQMYNDLPSFSVDYGATVSGLTESQLYTLAQTQPARIKLKWSDHLREDLIQLHQLDFKYQLAIDANESLNLSHQPDLQQLINDNVIYIEEPFKSLSLLDEVNAKQIPPVAIDEKATSIEQILTNIQTYPIEVVILKPFRLGGIDKVLELMQELQQQGVKVVVGGMYEYGLSRYFTALLAKAGDYPGDVTPAGYYFENDFVANSGVLKEGRIDFHPPQIDITKLHQV